MFSNIKKNLLAAAEGVQSEARAPSPKPSPKKSASNDLATKDDLAQENQVLLSQLARYKQRLSDVVQAYKALQKEKQALEQSLHALNSASTPQTQSQPQEEVRENGANTDDSDDVQALQQRLQTLAAAISTLSKEKAALQAAYLEDKKKLQLHKEDLQELSDERDRCVAELAALKQELAETPPAVDAAELVAARQALDAERERANRLDRQLAVLEASVQQRLADRDADRVRMQAELDDLAELCGELRARRQAAEVRESSLAADLATARDHIATLQIANASLEDQLAAALAPPQLPAAPEAAREPERESDPDPVPEPPTPSTPAHSEEELHACVEALVREHEARAAAAEARCTELAASLTQLHRDMAEMQLRHTAQISQLQEQQERTLSVKEKELSELKALVAAGPTQGQAALPAPAPETGARKVSGSEGGEPLLHEMYSQLARDRELAAAMAARAALKEQLDNAQLQLELNERQIRHLTDQLNDKVRAERRDNVNIEYLKNIMFKYFTAPAGQEQHLLRAICALLQFSPNETDRVLARDPKPKTSWLR